MRGAYLADRGGAEEGGNDDTDEGQDGLELANDLGEHLVEGNTREGGDEDNVEHVLRECACVHGYQCPCTQPLSVEKL